MLNSGFGDFQPALSHDELVIVFTSNRPIDAELGPSLWYATRQQVTDDFGMPRAIPSVNSHYNDSDPMLSDDGCTLYFASDRDDPTTGNSNLFRAEVMR